VLVAVIVFITVVAAVAACVTVYIWPAILTVPVRGTVPAFAATCTDTLPLPPNLTTPRTSNQDSPQNPHQFVDGNKPPVLPIVAGSKLEQLAENLAALEIRLSGEQLRPRLV
jgi:hypothetical protein